MNIAGFRFRGLQRTPKRWSVWITANYRITFGWSGENAVALDFEDYHWRKAMDTKTDYRQSTPVRLIREDILPSVGLSVTAAAKALGVSRQMLHEILAESRPLSATMCLKLSRLFGGSPAVWIRLQATYDLRKAERNKKTMERISRIVPMRPQAQGSNDAVSH
jgi:addiction module HigA family antidote